MNLISTIAAFAFLLLTASGCISSLSDISTIWLNDCNSLVTTLDASSGCHESLAIETVANKQPIRAIRILVFFAVPISFPARPLEEIHPERKGLPQTFIRILYLWEHGGIPPFPQVHVGGVEPSAPLDEPLSLHPPSISVGATTSIANRASLRSCATPKDSISFVLDSSSSTETVLFTTMTFSCQQPAQYSSYRSAPCNDPFFRVLTSM
jgi:hypothetical protein